MADKMMLSVEVDETLNAHVVKALEDGHYANVGDYLRELIRHDQEQAFDRRNIELLREAFDVSDVMCKPFDSAAFRAEMQQRFG